MQDWDRQNPTQIVTEMCGFVTILSGTFLLHRTKDMVDGEYTSLFTVWSPSEGKVEPFVGANAVVLPLLQVQDPPACLSMQMRMAMMLKVYHCERHEHAVTYHSCVGTPICL